MFSRTLCVLACCGLPFAAHAGIDAGQTAEVATWLLQAFLVVIVAVVLLCCGAFATGFFVWPPSPR
jgi:hypothetical protein